MLAEETREHGWRTADPDQRLLWQRQREKSGVCSTNLRLGGVFHHGTSCTAQRSCQHGVVLGDGGCFAGLTKVANCESIPSGVGPNGYVGGESDG